MPLNLNYYFKTNWCYNFQSKANSPAFSKVSSVELNEDQILACNKKHKKKHKKHKKSSKTKSKKTKHLDLLSEEDEPPSIKKPSKHSNHKPKTSKQKRAFRVNNFLKEIGFAQRFSCVL